VTVSRKLACAGALLGLTLPQSLPARAADADFSGGWTVNAHLVSGATLMTIASVCTFTQTAEFVSGTCKGPNGSCAASGLVNGAELYLNCRTIATNAPALAGFSTFKGTLGPDNFIRGVFTHSTFPHASGPFVAQKL
jgi:hypothetical protein